MIYKGNFALFKKALTTAKRKYFVLALSTTLLPLDKAVSFFNNLFYARYLC
jgi:hypothetical protein